MPDNWYWSRNGQQFGPVSFAELKKLAASRQLQPSDMVWTEGMVGWTPATQMQDLWPTVDPRFPPPPPPPPSPQGIFASLPDLSGAEVIVASNPPKDPVLMAMLSGCCFAGLGQIVLGQVTKGVAIIVGSLIIGVATHGLGVLVTAPLGGIDAYLTAKKLKAGKSVGQWEFF